MRPAPAGHRSRGLGLLRRGRRAGGGDLGAFALNAVVVLAFHPEEKRAGRSTTRGAAKDAGDNAHAVHLAGERDLLPWVSPSDFASLACLPQPPRSPPPWFPTTCHPAPMAEPLTRPRPLPCTSPRPRQTRLKREKDACVVLERDVTGSGDVDDLRRRRRPRRRLRDAEGELRCGIC